LSELAIAIAARRFKQVSTSMSGESLVGTTRCWINQQEVVLDEGLQPLQRRVG
jgi:hypothetical protein